jgi:hypothetical protein
MYCSRIQPKTIKVTKDIGWEVIKQFCYRRLVPNDFHSFGLIKGLKGIQKLEQNEYFHQHLYGYNN